jgi:hypothetical protein
MTRDATGDSTPGTIGDTHIKELALRRFWSGELTAPERPAIEAHAASCARCRARIKEFGDQQRRFQQEISFDRFAAGVERAARTPRRLPLVSRPTVRWFFPMISVAAALALTITFAPRLRPGDDVSINRTKGGSGITVQIAAAGAGPQRTAAVGASEALSPGERIRIGYQPGGHRYLTSVSIDDQGEVTPLYPETGYSLPLGLSRGPKPTTTFFLPDSVEFTGKGNEHLIVILGDQPLEVEAVKKAARAAYDKAHGDLAHLPALEISGEQFHRSFVKP